MAGLLLPEAKHTDLIQDFFGQPNLPPVFVAQRIPGSPVNYVTLDFIKPNAVLFHRDKGHTLIPLIAKRIGVRWDPPLAAGNPITVAFNVHPGDVDLAMHHALWLRKLNRVWKHTALIAHDPSLHASTVQKFQGLLAGCFSEVRVLQYDHPPIRHYPATANWAFQSVAIHMLNFKNPWLWMEADAVVLKANWLDELQAEYERAGKAWMGPHVEGMEHANGTMVYPPDAARRMPRAMECPPNQAFDMVSGEIMPECHNCSHLIFHTWSIMRGRFWPSGGGVTPMQIKPELARTIPPTSVMIHRIKDRSLIDLLLSGSYKPEN
jgi:hypothetical protein